MWAVMAEPVPRGRGATGDGGSVPMCTCALRCSVHARFCVRACLLGAVPMVWRVTCGSQQQTIEIATSAVT